jgi:LacI family transcriptional regulator
MSDIARRARVSITTVSHAINNTRPVAQETRDRILRVAREMNYYRNASARLLVRGRGDSFGLIISDIENPFYPELIKAFQTAAHDSGFDILLCTTNYDPDDARKAVQRMMENRVLGVALMTSQFESALADELVSHETPAVQLDAGQVRRAVSDIHIDYSHGAVQAIAHLRQLGHRRLALLTGPQGRVSAITYTNALLEAITAAGLPEPVVVEGNARVDGGIEGTRKLLASANRPTAILCGNDLAAIGALQAIQEAGLRAPEDVSVIGSDDISFARYTNPPLTTVRIPRGQLGTQAFRTLLKMHNSKSRRGIRLTVETELIIRRSTGPAARKGKAASS